MQAPKTVVVALLAAAGVPGAAAAQGRPVAELGTSAGVVVENAGGSTLTYFGIPGEGILGQPTLYASIFTASGIMLEPQAALNILSASGNTATTVGLGGGVGYLFKGARVNSAFAQGVIAFQSVSGGGVSHGEVALGARLGYRLVVKTTLGVRLEAGYRRWFDSHLNEFSFGVGLGAVLHSSK